MGAIVLGRPVTQDDLLWGICWILIVCGLCALMLLKGCCVASSSCETMLAECERGIEEMAAQLARDDGDAGCP